MTLLSSRTVRARKQHRCYHCDGVVETGQLYLHEVSTCDGFQVYRAHPECDRAARSYHRLCHLTWDEGVKLIDDVTDEDHGWLAEYHPAVAIRMGVALTPYF